MESKLLDVIITNTPGIAAMLYIIFFQGKELKTKREELVVLRTENDNLRLKNENLYLQIIGHFEAQVVGKRVRISKIPEYPANDSAQS